MAYDFEANVDARYTDTVVESKITSAEEWINEYCGQSFSGTIPNGVKLATKIISKYYMVQQMVEDDHLPPEKRQKFKDIIEEIKIPLKDHHRAITDSDVDNLWQ